MYVLLCRWFCVCAYMYSDGLQIFSWSCDHLAKSCDQIELLQASEALCIVRCMIVSLLSCCTIVSNTFFPVLCVYHQFSFCHCLFLCCITTYVPPKNTASHFFCYIQMYMYYCYTSLPFPFWNSPHSLLFSLFFFPLSLLVFTKFMCILGWCVVKCLPCTFFLSACTLILHNKYHFKNKKWYSCHITCIKTSTIQCQHRLLLVLLWWGWVIADHEWVCREVLRPPVCRTW